MIGIIGAMEQEVAELKKYVEIIDTKKILDYVFYQGIINGQEVVLLQSGIGKVNAAISTTLLLSNYDIDYVINIGSAGGLNLSQEVGDVIISDKIIHHDVDVTAFGRPMGQVPGMPSYFSADEHLVTKAKKVLQELNLSSSIGTIVSGDTFVSKQDTVNFIKKHFNDAKCVEMEAAAIAQTCHIFKVKFIITRSLSDVFGKGESSIQFDDYLKKASVASAKMCIALINEGK